MRVTGHNAKILFYSLEKETCLGLKIPGEMSEIEVSGMEINFVSDIKYVSFAEGLPDASGEFTGYFDKD